MCSIFDILFLFLFTSFSVNVYECFPTTHFFIFVLSLWTAYIVSLTQNSFSEEILQHNFSIDSISDGLVASDELAPRNSCAEELKQVVTEESIKDGRTDPSNCLKAVKKILIVDDEELEKRKESQMPPNTRINTSWGIRGFRP